MATQTKRKKGTPKGNRPPAGRRGGGRPPKGAVVPGKPGRRPAPGLSASQLIDKHLQELGDWRGETLARMRALILDADPAVVEEWKWSVPVWSHDGIVTTGETYKQVVKLTFAHGAFVPDPSNLFNASLGGGTRRAIDIRQGERVDEAAFKRLVKAAVALNVATARRR